MLTLLVLCIGLLAGVRGNGGTCSEVLETECEKAVSVAMVDIRRAKDDKPISFFFRTTTPLTAFQALSDQTEKYFDHPEDQGSPTFRAMFEGYEDRHVIVDDDVTLGAAFSAARDDKFLVLEGTFPTTPEPTPLPTGKPTMPEQLLFELPSFGSNNLRDEYSNAYAYWWKTGDAVSSGPGKRTTYDFLTISQIWFRLPSGLWGKYDLGQCDTLLNIMKGTTVTEASTNNNSGLWPEGHLKFDKIESEDPSFFKNDVVTVAQGDGSTDGADWVVFGFSTLTSQDWEGTRSPSIGCENYVAVCAPSCSDSSCSGTYEGTYEIWGKPC